MRKDVALDGLATHGNVAQFLGFRPGHGDRLVQTFNRIRGYPANYEFESPKAGIKALLKRSPEARVNIRSYHPDDPRGREFVYGLDTAEAALEAAERLVREGLFILVNETVDVTDGGVSGVVHGGIIEFAPDDTPRCVERPGVCSLPTAWGLSIFETIYGAKPPSVADGRLEFSIHPRPRGYRHGHVLTWEFEETPPPTDSARVTWPNRFSRLIGDKAFGLLIANEIGLSVPRTLVVGRRIAPFWFGAPTGSNECWIRTCPFEPQPGLYTTTKGWLDPFTLLQQEDSSGTVIASILRQDAVAAAYSGATIVGSEGALIIEGVRGEGDTFMLGEDVPTALPEHVLHDVRDVYDRGRDHLGPIRFEWVHDGEKVWVVQLHVGSTESSSQMLVPGDAAAWERFPAEKGLGGLRELLRNLAPDVGIVIEGEIGLTSHIADLIRKAQRPTKLVPKSAS